jgi:formylglycine-generating enzyme required for sulfatase activity
LEVLGGTYYRTYSNDGSGPTGEADPATVSTFRLDKYLVTVGRFRQFVNAWNSGWLPSPGSGKHVDLNNGNGLANAVGGDYEPGWIATDDSNIAPTNANFMTACNGEGTWTPSAGSQENLPITCANWYEAYAFCIWDGGFLPSEAEWEYAAAGGSQQREYPWGSADPGAGIGAVPPDTYAIFSCSGNVCDDSDLRTSAVPVGTASMGAGLWGQLDLAGDAWEWNLDWYDDPYVNPCADCARLTRISFGRVTRGGSFSDPAMVLVPPNRDTLDPTVRLVNFGFRCARRPLPAHP